MTHRTLRELAAAIALGAVCGTVLAAAYMERQPRYEQEADCWSPEAGYHNAPCVEE